MHSQGRFQRGRVPAKLDQLSADSLLNAGFTGGMEIAIPYSRCHVERAIDYRPFTQPNNPAKQMDYEAVRTTLSVAGHVY